HFAATLGESWTNSRSPTKGSQWLINNSSTRTSHSHLVGTLSDGPQTKTTPSLYSTHSSKLAAPTLIPQTAIPTGPRAIVVANQKHSWATTWPPVPIATRSSSPRKSAAGNRPLGCPKKTSTPRSTILLNASRRTTLISTTRTTTMKHSLHSSWPAPLIAWCKTAKYDTLRCRTFPHNGK